MVAPLFGVEKVMKATDSRWISLERVEKSCYFAQSCPINTFRDKAETNFIPVH